MGIKAFHCSLLEVLQSHFNVGDRIEGAEVGVAQAIGSALILSTFPNSYLYLVDAYRDWGLHRDMGVCLMQARNHTNAYCDRRMFLICLSTEAAPFFADESLDFVFIDASHFYTTVKVDLECWVPKVKQGGLLVGHDYNSARDKRGKWGVKRAVNEYAAEHGYVVQEHGDHIWSAVKKSNPK